MCTPATYSLSRSSLRFWQEVLWTLGSNNTVKEPAKVIKDAAETAHKLITELYQCDPANGTFEQVGIRDGRDTVMDFINQGEWGCALEHLLYMIHESDIEFPRETVQQLHHLAASHGVHNHYSRENQVNLTQEQINGIFNAP